MKQVLFALFLPVGIVCSSQSLRHELTENEFIIKRLESLERKVEDLESQLALEQEQRRRLEEGDSCLPKNVNGTCTFFGADIVFTNYTNFTGPVVFEYQSSFSSDDDSLDDSDTEFGVTFLTQVVHEQEALFGDYSEFEYNTLFEGDMIIEGPGARRQFRKLRKRDRDLKKSSSGDDPTKFEIHGEVDITLDSDEEAVIENDVCIGCDTRRRLERRGRRRRMSSSRAKLTTHDVETEGELHVEEDAEFDENFVCNKHIYIHDLDCIDPCESSGEDGPDDTGFTVEHRSLCP